MTHEQFEGFLNGVNGCHGGTRFPCKQKPDTGKTFCSEHTCDSCHGYAPWKTRLCQGCSRRHKRSLREEWEKEEARISAEFKANTAEVLTHEPTCYCHSCQKTVPRFTHFC